MTGGAGRPVDYHDARIHQGEFGLPQPTYILGKECSHGAIGGSGINHICPHKAAAHALSLKCVNDVTVGLGQSMSEPTAEAPRAGKAWSGMPGVARNMDGPEHGAKLRVPCGD